MKEYDKKDKKMYEAVYKEAMEMGYTDKLAGIYAVSYIEKKCDMLDDKGYESDDAEAYARGYAQGVVIGRVCMSMEETYRTSIPLTAEEEEKIIEETIKHLGFQTEEEFRRFCESPLMDGEKVIGFLRFSADKEYVCVCPVTEEENGFPAEFTATPVQYKEKKDGKYHFVATEETLNSHFDRWLTEEEAYDMIEKYDENYPLCEDNDNPSYFYFREMFEFGRCLVYVVEQEKTEVGRYCRYWGKSDGRYIFRTTDNRFYRLEETAAKDHIRGQFYGTVKGA